MPDDIKVRTMRNFRLMHNITLDEVAIAAGKTTQWISRIEIGTVKATNHNKYRMMQAYQIVIHNRQRAIDEMAGDYKKLKKSLFEEVPEWTPE